ncbi:hypothetical protein TNCV_4713841 [Trichonephila clavipes]|nr:hypothetical protein TNCV_4713841 [Trichonephila clavipes]
MLASVPLSSSILSRSARSLSLAIDLIFVRSFRRKRERIRKILAVDSSPRCCLLYHPFACQMFAMLDFMCLKKNKEVILEMML